MFMRMIYDDSLAQAAYLIGCQQTGEAIVVDPERDIDRYIKLAHENDLRIIAATETHIHADFLSGVREFCDQTDAKAYLSAEGGEDWDYRWVQGSRTDGQPYRFQLISDADVFQIGNIHFRVIHTPGHTPEHICFEVSDRGGDADEPMGVLTGDFVFVGDVGRPDLLETAAGVAGQREPSARALGESLRRFQSMPDYLQLWPGHGSGSACGKALGAVPQSTVGYEKKFNQAVKLSSVEDQFVNSILAGQPEPPKYFARMKNQNRLGPAVLGRLPEPSRCTTDEIPAESIVIDARSWDEYCAGHLLGSLSILPGKVFSTVAGAFVQPEQDVVLVCDENMLDDLVRKCIRVGLDRVVHWVSREDVERWSPLERVQEIDVHAVATLKDPIILDVRNASEFAEGHLPGATNVAYLQLPQRLDEVPVGSQVLVNCRSGIRSARAVSYIKRNGHDAVNIVGGYMAWEAAGLPIDLA